MSAATALALVETLAADTDMDLLMGREIERFLKGETDGELVLHALYGDTANEPIPDRLLAVLRNGC